MKKIITLLVAIVPIFCSAGQEDVLNSGMVGVIKYHNDVIRMVLPFCRMADWNEEPASCSTDFYGNWGVMVFTTEEESQVDGSLSVISFKRPLPSFFEVSTFEEFYDLYSESPFVIGGDLDCVEFETEVIEKTDTSAVVSYTIPTREGNSVMILKLCCTDGWFHILNLLYNDLNDEQLVEFRLKELPRVSEWFQVIEL